MRHLPFSRAQNEIHGGWFDPANPVVPMDGALRADNTQHLQQACSRADLVLALGTSLSGVSADKVVSRVAHRALGERKARQGSPLEAIPEGGVQPHIGSVDNGDGEAGALHALGSVIINVQQTRLDSVASLRIFAKLDDVMSALALELCLDVAADVPSIDEATASASSSHLWEGLPYDPETGEYDAERRAGKHCRPT